MRSTMSRLGGGPSVGEMRADAALMRHFCCCLLTSYAMRFLPRELRFEHNTKSASLVIEDFAKLPSECFYSNDGT